MPHILAMSVNPDAALRDRSCAPCNSSALAISCCGLCAFWVRINALPLMLCHECILPLLRSAPLLSCLASYDEPAGVC